MKDGLLTVLESGGGEAAHGGDIVTLDEYGDFELKVDVRLSKGANSGTVLRLKGKGVAKAGGGQGDQYVTLKVMLPEKPDPELEAFIDRWSKDKAYDPRRAMGV